MADPRIVEPYQVITGSRQRVEADFRPAIVQMDHPSYHSTIGAGSGSDVSMAGTAANGFRVPAQPEFSLEADVASLAAELLG